MTIVASAMLMLLAGYETTALNIGFALWDLANNPEVQRKLQAEVDEAYENHTGSSPVLDFHVLHEMSYLDQVFSL